MLRGVAKRGDHVGIVLHIAKSHGSVGAIGDGLGVLQLIHQLTGRFFEVERLQAGEYRLTKVSGSSKLGLLGWLNGCPEKDWFQTLPSESTAIPCGDAMPSVILITTGVLTSDASYTTTASDFGLET